MIDFRELEAHLWKQDADTLWRLAFVVPKAHKLILAIADARRRRARNGMARPVLRQAEG
jgi:hypothetical protein